ncbi:copper chaperone PCu(A)C [Pseudooceanicola sp. CBS1P-1]|uniref:Copper chaperone PCu(A)C n=1 Tax=Pseudooceanicola albus TaxID=2692189 RepID=A0A6L7G487_9RHOB|nr:MULTISPECIES: copper chaperone PCu(A)C [Pseudooceanicola]MBT9384637.1 copper chaperone PCu(A)C [Pseudooceanicola endophyticus]MXN18338.1 copper chaperone PCu(A)C [Pseudooceanicola albus]
MFAPRPLSRPCRLLTTLALGLALSPAGAPARADIVIDTPRVLAANPLARTAAAYLTLTNTGPGDDRLTDLSSPAAGRVALHESRDAGGGVMTMRPLPDGLALPAGQSRSLAPGGLHIMLSDLRAPLSPGSTLTLTLTFQKAGAVTLTLPVQSRLDRPLGSSGLPPRKTAP